MSEHNEKAEKVLKYIERSFTDPAFQPSADEELVIVERFKSPEQYVGVSDVFEAITQFANALTAKGRESFTQMELQLTLFTLIADVVTDKDVVEVVRCKNCAYMSMESGEFDGLEPACRFWTDADAIYPVFVDMNGYCSEGKRKERG